MRDVRFVITKIDLFLYSMMVLVSFVFLLNLDYRNGNGMVVFSFMINGAFFLWRCMSIKENVSIRRTIYIFMLFFMFFAPLQQYLSGTVLWSGNGLMIEFQDKDFIYGNLCIMLFTLLFELGYRCTKNQLKVVEYTYTIRTKGSLLTLQMVCICIFLVIVLLNGFTKIPVYSAMITQISNMMMLAPIEAYLLTEFILHSADSSLAEVKYVKKHRMLFAVEAVIIYGVYSGGMARFMFLGALMMIATFYLEDKKNKSLYFFIYFFGFFFTFSAIRGRGLNVTDAINYVNFNHVDFDAYQIYLGVIRYVSEHGITWGLNILSALLFLIPRKIIPWKMEATGGIIASNYGSWFVNISSPIPAELYFAFGIVGITFGGVLFGVLIKKIDGLMRANDQMKKVIFCLISGMTVYMMRGALLSTMSYMLGILLGFWFLTRVTFVKIK